IIATVFIPLLVTHPRFAARSARHRGRPRSRRRYAMRIEIPAARLAAPTNDDEALKAARRKMREALLRGESVVVRDGGQLAVPSLFWYENDPELYQLEVQAMTRRESPFRHFQLRKEADGRLAWLGTVAPGLLKGGKRTYTLHAVYDHNHPHNSTFGGSVKVY